MATTAYQSAYTGTQIDDAIGAVQTAAFVGDDDGTGGVVDSSASLADLTDTAISSPTNGQALLYNTATSKWVNGNVSGGGGDVNVIEIVKVNGSALTPDASKAVDVPVPTETTVSGWGFTKNTGTYSKPSGGIPKTDLASAVQTSLGKADTALQSYTESDPVFTASAAHGISSSDITNWNSKTSNVGTITGVTMNGSSKGTSGVVNLGTVITSETQLSKGNTSGSGNAVTDISVNNHTITLTKGTTFLTASDVVTIYSGSTAPSSSTGSNGDIYIQTS